ncbi:hypothetical protein EJ04DRAFT_142947 [Polyplosphaeria fusca]|uniref:Uncharacterized protein n=1 Tax=Polyplosphaeria fusca TaxID=682080 RepID=A0A9P4V4X3_9PLEO|nr:hypothetical protein EJ04DRAFT_142947 [Polyplosphaeria fusca]
MADDEIRPRTSRFQEGTMNSTTSIHPPPSDVWQELGIDNLIDRFNEENNTPAPSASTKPLPQTPSSTVPQSAFSKFSQSVRSFFQGSTFSGLGKRKAEHISKDDKEQRAKDDRKAEAERAYHLAKEQGLLPTPKVFNRPIARSRKPLSSSPNVQAERTLRASTSKKDLAKQAKLSKRVSNLEQKLVEARRELLVVMNGENAPPVPVLPQPPPEAPSVSPEPKQSETPTPAPTVEVMKKQESTTAAVASAPPRKIVKKRKINDNSYVSTESESDSSVKSKKAKSKTTKKLKRSTRLTKKRSTIAPDYAVVVVPDGMEVPPLPSIPNGVQGKRVAVRGREDGYGGLEHEMF